MKNKQDISKKDLVEFCRITYASGLVSGVGGNLSIRSGDMVYTTPTGYSLRDIDLTEVVCVDISGRVIGKGVPTKDIEMHLGIMNARPDIHAVCHAHGAHIIAASAIMEPGPRTLPPLTPGFIYFSYPLAMIPFMVPGTKALAEMITKHFSAKDTRSLLLQNHGLVTVGKDFREAVNIAEEIDEAAKIWILTNGKAKVISEDDVIRIRGL